MFSTEDGEGFESGGAVSVEANNFSAQKMGVVGGWIYLGFCMTRRSGSRLDFISRYVGFCIFIIWTRECDMLDIPILVLVDWNELKLAAAVVRTCGSYSTNAREHI